MRGVRGTCEARAGDYTIDFGIHAVLFDVSSISIGCARPGDNERLRTRHGAASDDTLRGSVGCGVRRAIIHRRIGVRSNGIHSDNRNLVVSSILQISKLARRRGAVGIAHLVAGIQGHFVASDCFTTSIGRCIPTHSHEPAAHLGAGNDVHV